MNRLALLALLVAAPSLAAVPPREDLKTLTAQLAKSPSDDALREKLLKAAAKLKAKPATPVEARRHFVKGVTLQKDAKDAGEMTAAVNEYRLALAEAPWWADAYYNMAVAQESAGDFTGARKSLGFYLLTGPKDAEAAQNKLFALEAKSDKAALAAAKAAAEAEKFSWLTGNWNETLTTGGKTWGPFPLKGTRTGDIVLIGGVNDADPNIRATIKDGTVAWETLTRAYENRPANCPLPLWEPVSATVSADHRRVSFTYPSHWTHDCDPAGYTAYNRVDLSK